MSKQDIIDRIRKVKRLAENGVDGEKDSARLRVEELMKRYGITDADLEEEKEVLFTYYVEGMFCWDLFKQIAGVKYNLRKFRYLPKAHLSKGDREAIKVIAEGKKHNILISCTAAQFVELTAEYEIFQRGLTEQADAFFYAFLSRNRLLAEATEEESRELSEKERKMVRNAILMSQGIEKVETHKLIEA